MFNRQRSRSLDRKPTFCNAAMEFGVLIFYQQSEITRMTTPQREERPAPRKNALWASACGFPSTCTGLRGEGGGVPGSAVRPQNSTKVTLSTPLPKFPALVFALDN